MNAAKEKLTVFNAAVRNDNQTMCLVKSDGKKVQLIENIPIGQGGYVKGSTLSVIEMTQKQFEKSYTIKDKYSLTVLYMLFEKQFENFCGEEGVEELIQELRTYTEADANEKRLKSIEKIKQKEEFDMAAKNREKEDKKAERAAKKEAAAAEKVAKKKDKEGKPSVANFMKNLIMEGKLSAEQIFEAAKKEFGLDDSKKGYPRWYYNDMVKKGLNPPELKMAEKKSSKKAK